MRKSNKDEFIRKAFNVHGEEYIYSRVDYKGNNVKVEIICKKHGVFLQTPNHHLQGCRCPFCIKEEKIAKEKHSFIEKSNKVHNCRYSYNHVDYINNHTNVAITCPVHGDFMQTPKMHMFGNGCPKCGNEHKSKIKIESNRKTFMPKAIKIHGDRYDYSRALYKGHREKLCIICKEHGEFWQTPSIHLNGGNCPKCKQSSLEYEIETALRLNGIAYDYQKKFEWLGLKSLDFYLPKYNIAIECQGEQHYRPIGFFGGEDRFMSQKERDKDKLNECNKNDVTLLYYSKSDLASKNTFKNVNDLIKEIKSHDK